MLGRFFITMLLGISLAFAPKAEATTLTLDPSGGALSGHPGDIVGWGFTFTNPADYAVITSAQFDFLVNIGTFTDFTVVNFYLAGAPPETAAVTQPFSLSGQTGIGSFQIAADAISGSLADGSIVITYDLYNLSPNDPGFDPIDNLVSNGNQLTAAASVQVLGGEPVPEPSTCLLIAFGLAGAGVIRRVRRK